MPPDPMSSGSASEYAGDANVAPAATPSVDGAVFEGPQHEANRRAAEAVAQEVQPVSRLLRTPRGAARKRAKPAPARGIAHISMGVHEDQSAQSRAARAPISFDEVAILDAENKRLKRLLAEQLHARNAQLRKMLERFDIT
ncbi:MAG: hypothetical protein AAAC47_05790 [Pararhizobium sp.]